jgi:hypothetical protein
VQSSNSSKPLEDLSSKHEEEMQSLREELEEANEGKEHFETQYKNLLGRVNTIKTSLGDRLKADAVGYPSFTTFATAENSLGTDADSCRLESRNSTVRFQTLRSRFASCKRTTTP